MQKLKVNLFVINSVKSVIYRSISTSVVSHTTVNVADNTTQLSKSWKKIPGPSTIPFLGTFHHFLPGGFLHGLTGYQMSERLYDKFGSIVRVDGAFGSPTLLFLYDTESIAQVLYSENWMPIRPGLETIAYFRKQHNKPKEGVSTGLLTEHGEKWKSFRSAVNPVMLQSKTIKLYNTVIDNVAQEFVARLRTIRDGENKLTEPLNIELNKWSLESIGVIALGGRIGSLDPNMPEDSPARRLIQCVHNIFHILDELEFKPSLWRVYSTPGFKRAMKLYQEQVDLSRYFIQKAVKTYNDRKSKGTEEEKAILEKLLEVDEDVAIYMASDMLLAGVDTAANTMIAVLYLLGKNPEVQMKLREEILSKDDRQQYLKACIKESMRILPIVFGNMRESTKEYNLNGYLIPKGVRLIIPNEYISRQESQFDRANDFIPERWLQKEEKSKAHPLATIPFGFGARACIGRRIAELEMETLLARMIENFHVEWSGPPIRQETKAVTYMLGPYHFTFKDAK